MATLAQWLSDLATRLGAEIKAVRAELNNRISKLYPTVEGGLTISNPNEWETSDLDFTNFNDFRTAHFRTYYEPGYSEFIMSMKSPVGPGYTTNVLKIEGETGVFDFRHRPVWKATVNGSPVAATPWDSVNFKPADYAKLDSPALIGNPTAPTQSAFNNSNRIATTAFVQVAISAKADLSGATFTGPISAPNHLTTFSTFVSGKPAANEVVGGQIFPVATTITQANCRAVATVAATASTVFTIRKDAVTLGTITFAAGATLGTISITSGAVAALQNVTITAPATPDATLANVSFLVRA